MDASTLTTVNKGNQSPETREMPLKINDEVVRVLKRLAKDESLWKNADKIVQIIIFVFFLSIVDNIDHLMQQEQPWFPTVTKFL